MNMNACGEGTGVRVWKKELLKGSRRRGVELGTEAMYVRTYLLTQDVM